MILLTTEHAETSIQVSKFAAVTNMTAMFYNNTALVRTMDPDLYWNNSSA